MSALKQKDDKELLLKEWSRQYTLDSLDNPEMRVKVLRELYNRPMNERAINSRIVDRVGDFLSIEDKQIRMLAIDVYVAVLNNNPELATKERTNKFLELAKEERNPAVKKLFIRRLNTPIEGFKKLDSDTRTELFKWIFDTEPGVRYEARETVQHNFNIPAEAMGDIYKQLSKFTPDQAKDVLGRMAGLTEEIEKTNQDAGMVFSGIAKVMKGISKHDFEELKFLVHSAKNLLLGKGNPDGFNECLSQGLELYKDINEKIKPGTDAWRNVLQDMFVEKIPKLAKEIDYSELGKRLKEVVEEVKKEEPQEFRHSAFYVLEHGKLSI